MSYRAIIAVVAVAALCGCRGVNNKEVPAYPVHLDLGTYGLWNTYGVTAAGDIKYFNRAKQLPANFPYTSLTYTGCGGVLLVMGFGDEVLAYDAACPVENNPTVSVQPDASSFELVVCPQCKSQYNVYSYGGLPVSGNATTLNYGLRTLTVATTGNGGYLITQHY